VANAGTEANVVNRKIERHISIGKVLPFFQKLACPAQKKHPAKKVRIQ